MSSRAFGEAGAGHAFAQAAILYKGLFQPAELLVKEVVGQFDQANHHIGGNRRVDAQCLS